jgi:hypothetical protein
MQAALGFVQNVQNIIYDTIVPFIDIEYHLHHVAHSIGMHLLVGW